MNSLGVILQLGGGILAIIALFAVGTYICDNVESWFDEWRSD